MSYRETAPSRNWQIAYFRQCGHKQIFKSHTKRIAYGQLRWCKCCADIRRVQRVPVVWAVRCLGCSYGRFFAEDERGAARAVGAHKSKNPTHTTVLYRDGREDKRLGPGTLSQIPGLGVGGIDDRRQIIPFYVSGFET